MPPDDSTPDKTGYVLPTQNKVIQPLNQPQPAQDNPAIDLIRRKLDALFETEPPAEQETREVVQLVHRSKHQQFMYDLTNSGKALAEIQQAWHAYYENLPDHEKHQVWQEFYAAQGSTSTRNTPEPKASNQHTKAHSDTSHQAHNTPRQHEHTPHHTANNPVPVTPAASESPRVITSTEANQPTKDQPSVSEIREELLQKVRSRSKAKPSRKQHHQSLLFGLSMGLVAMGVLSFGFFNERFIAPFITPSRAVSSTPLIIDPGSGSIGTDPEVIIPKINVQIPVVYDVKTIVEEDVQVGLERGVVHYPITPMPGENGNGVIFGHSANNILNKGKYKFAFVLLRKLDINDTFYIHKDGKRYVYRVYEKKVVPPTDLSVLKPQDKPATFTLITCDPPGTSLNRLVIVGEQISPDPAGNSQSTAAQQPATETSPATLPSNSPTLWSRLTGWLDN